MTGKNNRRYKLNYCLKLKCHTEINLRFNKIYITDFVKWLCVQKQKKNLHLLFSAPKKTGRMLTVPISTDFLFFCD